MPKANVIVPYVDKHTGVLNRKGDVVELTEERAAELAAGGYVEAAPAKKAAPRKRTAAKKAE